MANRSIPEWKDQAIRKRYRQAEKVGEQMKIVVLFARKIAVGRSKCYQIMTEERTVFERRAISQSGQSGHLRGLTSRK